MDERQFLDVISGRQSGMTATLMRAGLSLATPFYRSAVGVRNALFDAQLKRIEQAGVPVVSVGNITAGGTGKTPLVAWVAQWFTARGKRPVFVSRGYRSLDQRGNDEQRVLEQLCPGVPHEQQKDRVAAARRAMEQHQPDVVILDDGFQHRRLARNLDLVLIDALNPWGYGRLLPRGLLREPKTSLRRADAVTITRVDQCSDDALAKLKAEVGRYSSAPISEVAFPPQRLLSADGQTADLAVLTGKRLLGFCGIGNPESFRRTVSACGYADDDLPIEAFPDHHHYTAEDFERLERIAETRQVEAFVTTQKDLVKINPEWLDQWPVWAVVIGAKFRNGEADITGLLNALIDETHTAPDG